MNLRSKFVKKPWEQKDPEARAVAVRQHEDPALKAELPNLAQHDPSVQVRLAALQRIDTEPFWLDARLRETDTSIIEAADSFLARSALKTDKPDLESARLEWLAKIKDPEMLRKTAAGATSKALRRAALLRINSQGFLGDCYESEPDETLAEEILARIHQTSTLERLIASLRGHNKRRTRAATDTLERIRSASGEAQAGQAASARLVQEAEQLARGNFSGDAGEVLENLQKRWLAIADHPQAMIQRFESALRIARAARERPAPERTDEPAPPTAVEPPAPDPGLSAAADHVRTRIRQDRKANPAELLASWDRAWNQLEEVAPADEQLKEDMLPLLRELQAQIQQHSKRKTSGPALSGAAKDNAQALPDFEPRLDQVAALLEAGEIAQAHEMIHRLRADYERLPQRRRPAPVGGRLQRMEGRLKEMRDWQHWSNNKIRNELIAQVESLPESGQHPDAITAALKKSRSEWKRLEALEILPGDKRRFAAPSGQWRRFQAACKSAFEAARPYFEKREQVQKDNLDTLKAFIEAGQATAATEDSSADEILGFLRKARQAIRRMDDLPPKSRGASAAGLRSLMDQLSKRLDEKFETVEAEKRKLVTEARVLSHEKDLKTAIDKAKSLQQRWQRTGSGRRKVEQALWREFREPIDPLFEKLKGEQTQQREAGQQAMAELEALCQQAEELAKAPEDELDSARSRFSGLLQQWLQQDIRPSRLNQRFERAEHRLNDRRKRHQQRALTRRQDRLWSLARTVQELWSQRCQGSGGDLSEQIPAVDEDDSTIKGLLVTARQVAAADFDADRLGAAAEQGLQSARQIAVEMEFLSGLDTPDIDQPLRMDYQVKRLARRMSEREHQPDLAAELGQLQTRWLNSLPHPPQGHDELQRRFTRAREVIEGMVGSG